MIEEMRSLTSEEIDRLLELLKNRFQCNVQRHEGIKWKSVQDRLLEEPTKLWTLHQMEASGGEPDVTAYEQESGQFIFVDCCMESPMGRRNLCYDNAALTSRKMNKPLDSALGMSLSMGAKLLTEQEYRTLQKIGQFDQKTSSWVVTPNEIRSRGGALFCDRRYDHVFVYHNGAESYYNARGFRALIRI